MRFHLARCVLLLAGLASAAPLHPDYFPPGSCSNDPYSPRACGPGLECVLAETPLHPGSCRPLMLRRQVDSSPSLPTTTTQGPDSPTASDASTSSTIDGAIPTTNNEPPPAAPTTEPEQQQSSSSAGLPVSLNPAETETTTSISSTHSPTSATSVSKPTSVPPKTTSLFAPSIGSNVRSSATVGDRTATIAPLSNVGLIVGGACGFLVLVLVAVLVFFYMKPAEAPQDVFDDFVAKRRATFIREDAQRQRLQKSRPYAQLEE
ncbi:hypothetical protein HDU81_002176 [Chytriomyces hyalinus]|nr:hypothetical protein HDU81_002176 [Chytriomyces hyalinus]